MTNVLAALLDVHGRLSRGGLWLVYLGTMGFALVTLPFVVMFRARPEFTMLVWSPVMALLLLAMIRRLHDRGKSAWSLLGVYGPMLLVMLLVAVFRIFPSDGAPGYALVALMLAAMAAVLWFIVQLFLLPGTTGPNRFGPDPLQSDGGGALSRAIAFVTRR